MLVNLIPFLGLIPIPNVHSPIAERYLYLASAGLALTFTGLMARGGAAKRPMGWASGAICALAILGIGHLTMARSRVWTSEIALWQASVETAPANYKAWVNLALATAQSGDWAQAATQVRQAIAIKPESPAAHFLLGAMLAAMARPEEAVRSLETTLRLDPNHRDAHKLIHALEKQPPK